VCASKGRLTTKLFTVVGFEIDDSVEAVLTGWLLEFPGGKKCQFPRPVPKNIKAFHSDPEFLPPDYWPVYKVHEVTTSGMALKAQLICNHIILCQVVVIEVIYFVTSFRFIQESAR